MKGEKYVYTVYIADDEHLICEGLAESIPWGAIDMQVVGTAENGRDALNGIREKKPDIVLTDIRMPYMDGLELIEKIKVVRPDCRILIITGHAEFEYAQTAIKLGVEDFILKPIDIDALCITLKKIRDDLDEESQKKSEEENMRVQLKRSEKERFSRVLLNYMLGKIHKDKLEESFPNDFCKEHAAFILLSVHIDDFDVHTAKMNEENIFMMTQEFENSVLKAGENCEKIMMEEATANYLILFMGNYPKELESEVGFFIRKLRMIADGIEFTTSISEPFDDINLSQKAYDIVKRGYGHSFWIGNNKDIKPEDISERASETLPDIPDIDSVILSITSFDKMRIRRDLDKMVEDIRNTGHNSYLYMNMMVSVVYREIIRALDKAGCLIDSIIDDPMNYFRRIISSKTLDGMIDELYGFIAVICDFMDENNKANNNIINCAKVYVDSNFSDPNLTLQKVSDEMGLSPNYFSALFKQNSGSSFINYLTHVRIERAKEYLMSGKFKTYEVAYKCGYENPAYFSTIFKKIVGVSPSDYQKPVN